MQTVGETGSRAGGRTAAGPKYYTADRENTLVRWARPYSAAEILDAMLKANGKEIAGKTIAVSGAGNVAIYAIEKAQQLGA